MEDLSYQEVLLLKMSALLSLRIFQYPLSMQRLFYICQVRFDLFFTLSKSLHKQKDPLYAGSHPHIMNVSSYGK